MAKLKLFSYRTNTYRLGSDSPCIVFAVANSFSDFTKLIRHVDLNKPDKYYTKSSSIIDDDYYQFAEKNLGCVCYVPVNSDEPFKVYNSQPYNFSNNVLKDCAYNEHGEGVSFEVEINKPNKNPNERSILTKHKIVLNKPINDKYKGYVNQFKYTLDDWIVDLLKGKTLQLRTGSFGSESTTVKYSNDMSKTLSSDSLEQLNKKILEVYSHVNHLRDLDRKSFTSWILYRFVSASNMNRKSNYDSSDLGVVINNTFEWGVFQISSCGDYIKRDGNNLYINKRHQEFYGLGDNPFKRIPNTPQNLAIFNNIENAMLNIGKMFNELNSMESNNFLESIINNQLLLGSK